MRKKLALGILLFICVCKMNTVIVYANHGVSVRIEGKLSTIASTNTHAYTFMEAIENIARQENLQITMISKDSSVEIAAVNGLQTDSTNPFDGWIGYVIRNNAIMQPADISRFSLLEGDEVVLYFGPVDAKKIMLQHEVAGASLIIWAQTDFSYWDYSSWPPFVKQVHEKISGINVHVRYPNKTEQIVKTDQNGASYFDISHPGKYVFFAEGYQSGVNTVKAKETEVILGVHNVEKLTRSEFIAMLVHDIEKNPISYDNIEAASFKDTTNTLYEKEIQMARNKGFISGYPDGTFKPENPITLVEALQILSMHYKSEYDMFMSKEIYSEELSVWANKAVAFAYAKNILYNKETNYYRTISLEEAETLLERWRR